MLKAFLAVVASVSLVLLSMSGPAVSEENPGLASVWAPLGPDGGDIQGLVRNPRSPNELYAATESGFVYRSTNGGSSWTRTANIGEELYDLVLDPKSPATVYVLGRNILFRSTDKGAGFTPFPIGSYWRPGWDGRMAVDPSNPRIIYIAGSSDNQKDLVVLKSVDGGQTWTLKTLGGGYTAFARGIAVSPKNPSALYVCGYYFDNNYNGRALIFVSTNAGASWRKITPGNLGANNLALGLAIDPRNPARIFVATSFGVIRSENSGLTWRAQTSPSTIYPECLALDQARHNVLYAGGNRVCYKSVDGGITWSEVAGGLLGIASRILASGNTIHLGSSAGIFKSVNGGLSFVKSQAGIKAFPVSNLSIPASASSATIYAAAQNYGVFRTTNRGGSWAKLASLPTNVDVSDLVASNRDPKRVYISTYG